MFLHFLPQGATYRTALSSLSLKARISLLQLRSTGILRGLQTWRSTDVRSKLRSKPGGASVDPLAVVVREGDIGDGDDPGADRQSDGPLCHDGHLLPRQVFGGSVFKHDFQIKDEFNLTSSAVDDFIGGDVGDGGSGQGQTVSSHGPDLAA